MWWYSDKVRGTRIFTWVILLVVPVFFSDDGTIQIVGGAGIGLLGLALELYWLKLRFPKGIVSDANAKNFSITKGMKTYTFDWKAVEELRWEGKYIDLVMKNGTWIGISNRVSGWEKILLAAPKELVAEKYQLIKETLDLHHQKYLPCSICGWKAVESEDNREGYCDVCGNDQWHTKMSQSKEDYVRQCQLEHFSTESPHEKVDFDKPEKGYQRHTTWSPMVTELEVIEYSKQYGD